MSDEKIREFLPFWPLRGAGNFDIIPSGRGACPVMNLMRDAEVAVTAEWNTVSKSK